MGLISLIRYSVFKVLCKSCSSKSLTLWLLMGRFGKSNSLHRANRFIRPLVECCRSHTRSRTLLSVAHAVHRGLLCRSRLCTLTVPLQRISVTLPLRGRGNPLLRRGLTEILCCGSQETLKGLLKSGRAFTTPKGLWQKGANRHTPRSAFPKRPKPQRGFEIRRQQHTEVGVDDPKQANPHRGIDLRLTR